MSPSTLCTVCRTVNPSGATHCAQCGSTISPSSRARMTIAVCTRCGSPSLVGSKYCQQCGSAFPSAMVTPRVRFVLIKDGEDQTQFPFEATRIEVGSGTCELSFPNDPYLSEKQCVFSWGDNRWSVLDLQSRNGVYLRLRRGMALEGRDVILFGRHLYRFDYLEETERNAVPLAEEGVMLFGTPLGDPWGQLRQLTAAGTIRDVHFLHRNLVVIGRQEGEILFPDDVFLSRKHLALSFDGKTGFIEDLSSSNGTYLRVRTQNVVEDGDILRIGDQLLRFEKIES